MRHQRWFQILIAAGLFLSLSSAVFAAPQSPATKFGRGLTNVLGAPLEIFIQPVRIGAVDHKPALTLTLGPFQGLYFMAVRAVVGAKEIFTFASPGPTQYGPTLLPETVHDGILSLSLREWPYPRNGFAKKEDPLGSHDRL